MAVWNAKMNTALKSNFNEKDSRALVTRINYLVEEENAVIERNCLKIGRKYAQLHTLDYEEAFEDQMREIAQSRQKLDDYSMQMQFATGIVICKGCGHEAPKGSIYCNMCGSKLPEINFDRFEICVNCGNLVEKGTEFCSVCSYSMVPKNVGYVKCSSCGELVDKKNRFCPECATPLHSNMSNALPTNAQLEKICPRCGSQMRYDMRYCTACAAELK